jgi:hypothetical protein
MWGASAMLQLAIAGQSDSGLVAGQSGCGTMYLFTLVFILLTVFGIFTEIVALQNNRFAAMRTGGAQQMVAWHASTVTAARHSVGGAAAFPNWGTAVNPCSIVAGAQAPIGGMPAVCRDALGVAAMRLDALVVAAGNTINFLPAGMNANNMLFNTVLATDAGGSNTRLAITFIGPRGAQNANAPLAPVGMNTTQLNRQLLRLNVEKTGFGYVVNGQLQPAASPDPTVNGIYTLPPALVFNAATNPTGPIRAGDLALFTPL